MEYGAEPSDSADATSLLEAHQHDYVCIYCMYSKIRIFYSSNYIRC